MFLLTTTTFSVFSSPVAGSRTFLSVGFGALNCSMPASDSADTAAFRVFGSGTYTYCLPCPLIAFASADFIFSERTTSDLEFTTAMPGTGFCFLRRSQSSSL